MRNKILVNFYLESGCSQEQGEVSTSWAPINFKIYSPVFIDLIDTAISEWLSVNALPTEVNYEVIFRHEMDHDLNGAVMDEYFLPVLVESEGRRDSTNPVAPKADATPETGERG